MAAALINAAVAKALYATQIETLDAFKAFLVTKDDVDTDFMDELITSFKGTLTEPKVADAAAKKGSKKGGKKADNSDGTSDGAEKKKRAPSAYTMYIQYQMGQLKKTNPDIKSGKDLMAKAVEAWGELTDENKAELKSLLKEEPTLTSEELVTRTLGGNTAVSPAGIVSDEEAEPEEAEPEEPKKKASKKAAAKKA